MEINSSNLQNAISTGLESVTSGITQASSVAGPGALGIAQQSFSSVDPGSASTLDLPVIGSAAEYPSVKEYYFSDADQR
jgi:hypothetical protein